MSGTGAQTVVAVIGCAILALPVWLIMCTILHLYHVVKKFCNRAREKEKAKVQKDIDFLSGKLNNQGFLAKAPEKLIEAEKAKLAKAEEKMAKIEQSMAGLK